MNSPAASKDQLRSLTQQAQHWRMSSVFPLKASAGQAFRDAIHSFIFCRAAGVHPPFLTRRRKAPARLGCI